MTVGSDRVASASCRSDMSDCELLRGRRLLCLCPVAPLVGFDGLLGQDCSPCRVTVALEVWYLVLEDPVVVALRARGKPILQTGLRACWR